MLLIPKTNIAFMIWRRYADTYFCKSVSFLKSN